MAFLLEAIESAAKKSGSITFLGGERDEQVGWPELYHDAVALAITIAERGVAPGDPLVILALTSRPAVTAALAGWLAGASVTFAPTPARTMSEDDYLTATKDRLDAIRSPLLLVGEHWAGLGPSLEGPGRATADLDELLRAALSSERRSWQPPAVSNHDPVILQMTSGTTDAPKTVRLSHANLAANVDAIKLATGHDAVHGRMLSWLPLSHDMGLIGGLVIPLSCGHCDVLLSSPVAYLARPADWMRQIARHRATATVGPNSAYAVAATLLANGPILDLSSLRVALSGGEPVDPDTVDAFTAAGARHGMNPGVILPAYGLAEATVAVTMAPLGRGLRCDLADSDALEQRGEAVPPEVHGQDLAGKGDSDRSSAAAIHNTGPPPRARRLPLLGTPVSGVSVRIVESVTAAVLPERRVGEIQVRGASVTDGYHDDPLASAQLVTSDGWLRTGDLGYLANGELVVTGRAKDVIIIGGRNIYPDDVERAAARAAGVRPGNVVAFSSHRPTVLGGEGVAIAVESRSDQPDVVRAGVTAEVRKSLGISPNFVAVLPVGSIPKTPSGKLQRREAARRFTPVIASADKAP